jgi:SAM-dependent methyltransferase
MDDWNSLYNSGGYGGCGSGTGSILHNNTDLINWLIKYIKSNTIESMVDIGCGDMQWMPNLIQDVQVEYTGIDYIDYLIDHNTIQFPWGQFKCIDFLQPDHTLDETYDLAFSKDVLHHCNEAESAVFLKNFQSINATHKLLVLPFNSEYRMGMKIAEYQCDYIKEIYEVT